MSIFVFIFILFLVGLFLYAFILDFGFKRADEEGTKRDEQLVDNLDQMIDRVSRESRLIAQHQEILNDNTNKLVKTLYEFNDFINLQLQKIESLIESDLRSARQEELIRTKDYKLVLERIMSMNNLSRQPPIGSDVLAHESATRRIDELEYILNPEKSPSE